MWPFSLSQRHRRAVERDAILQDIKTAQQNKDTPAIYAAFERYFAGKHCQGITGIETVNKAMFAIDRYDMAESLRFATWCLPHMDRTEKTYVASMIMLITEVPGREDAQTLAGICDGMKALAQQRVSTDYEWSAADRWHKTFDKLKKLDADMALRVAVEAVINGGTKPHNSSLRLRAIALNAWQEMVESKAAQNPDDAKGEAARVAEGYESYNTDGDIFRLRARRVLSRLGQPS
ncbi:MAG: hypothetical protein KKA05_02280 [Alphaproteobacteria bacterium]|nr:hypothetical protein [Alphaproteobacteria bacterium]MBU0858657.1 hypothetical protein [Alphaproteobacteria bacterium]